MYAGGLPKYTSHCVTKPLDSSTYCGEVHHLGRPEHQGRALGAKPPADYSILSEQ